MTTEAQAGMRRALDNADENWKTLFQNQALMFAQVGKRFTSEDILEIVGLPRGEIGRDRNNAVGAMMSSLSSQKLIVPTGQHRRSQRRSSHGAKLTEWIGAKYAKPKPSKDATGTDADANLLLEKVIAKIIKDHRNPHAGEASVDPLSGYCSICYEDAPCEWTRLRKEASALLKARRA